MIAQANYTSSYIAKFHSSFLSINMGTLLVQFRFCHCCHCCVPWIRMRLDSTGQGTVQDKVPEHAITNYMGWG
jgi:hypothetical protein